MEIKVSRKIFEKLLKYFDTQLFGDKTNETNWNYLGNTLDYLFEDYKYRNNYLDIDDYLEEKANIRFSEEMFEVAYKGLEEENRLNFIVAIYNIFYFSDTKPEVKQRLYSFFYKQKIIFNEDPVYKVPLNIKKIAEGSFANVIAIDEELVYKQLKSEYWTHKDKVSRFKYEFEIQKKLMENSIFLHVFDYNPIEYKYMMTRAECNLEEYLKKNKNIKLENKIEIIFQILEKLKFAHNKGVIHRDLHIGNILIKEDKFYIVDFGFAKHEDLVRSLRTSSSSRITHLFAAPESFASLNQVDKFSDIFSLGKIIDIVMSGDLSFHKEHELKYIVSKCCRREKEARFSNIDGIIEAIKMEMNNKDDLLLLNNIDELIKKNIVNPQIESHLSNLIKAERLTSVIFEKKWGDFEKIILKLDNELQVKIIEHFSEKGVKSTRGGVWSDYSILGKIAYKLLISNNFSSEQEIQLCNVLNVCSNRFDIQNLINKIILNNNTTLRLQYLKK